jgi:translation initiation factor IF-2
VTVKTPDKNSEKNTESPGVTVQQFADEIGISPERLLTQFKDAKISIKKIEDSVTEEQKQKLLRYLQQHHGARADTGPEKIILRRAKTSEIKVGGSHGAKKTVSIQVRKKRTFVKRPAQDEAVSLKSPETESLLVVEELIENIEKPVMQPDIAEQSGAKSADLTALPAENLTAIPELPAETVATDQATVYTEQPEPKIEDPAKLAEGLKRKEKHRLSGAEEEAENERQKKKKKGRSSTFEENRNYESLLGRRTTNLKTVLNKDDEELISPMQKRGGKARGALAKVQVQAFTKPTLPMVHEVPITETITVAELAQKMSLKVAEVIKILLKMEMIATINQVLDQETAVLVIEEAGHKAKLISSQALEEELIESTKIQGEAKSRPPVITIMGHVDHGKTTLLDYIRTTKVAAGEAGGITQHIGAYHVKIPKGTITFLDTPGHAAFTAMRARGAKLTDIVILVVAADDGVMPQTIEAIEHAKAARVPIVIAVNKMDKQGVDPERIKAELGKYNLIPEEWGGDTMFIPISAKTGMGVDTLLDSVLVQAEILELKAVENAPARGVVIESRLDRGRGSIMSVLVQQGTLHKGDIILAGLDYGRIRALFDENGKAVEKAGPSIPVEVLGLSGVPQAGDDFLVIADEKRAREVALFRQNKHRENKLARQAPKMEDLLQRIEEKKAGGAIVNIVLKTDVQGSVEALRQALSELSGTEVKVNIISSGIGGINESDVNLAIASKAIMFGFNVRANAEARKLIEKNAITVHYHNIIYDVINQVKKAISGVMAPEIQEKIVGLAQVREVFRSSKTGAVAGCMVIEGIVKRNFPIRVLRDNVVIFEGSLESLRRFKEDASEVRNGMECGIAVKNYNDIKAGDQIEVFERIEIKREW